MSQPYYIIPSQQDNKNQNILNYYQAQEINYAPDNLQEANIFSTYKENYLPLTANNYESYPSNIINQINLKEDKSNQQFLNYEPNAISYSPYQVQSIPQQQRIYSQITLPQQNPLIYIPKNIPQNFNHIQNNIQKIENIPLQQIKIQNNLIKNQQIINPYNNNINNNNLNINRYQQNINQKEAFNNIKTNNLINLPYNKHDIHFINQPIYENYENKNIIILGKGNDCIINKKNINKINEIKCIYNKQKDEINLLHDYNDDMNNWKEDFKKSYLEAKKNIKENNIEIYINNKIIKFNYKYKSNETGNISVKFKFNQLLQNTCSMFDGCKSLVSIDLSSFDSTNIHDMSFMFCQCQSLKSLNLSSLNTINVNNMESMFYNCESLISLDLSSFNTSNVYTMTGMFSKCSSLESLDLSSFNTMKVRGMSYMFDFCTSLKSINLSSFNTINVNDMCHMFDFCKSLKLIDLSSFNTSNVEDMKWMFEQCKSLVTLDLSSFNTIKVNNMEGMFIDCPYLKSINLSSFNTSNVKNMVGMFHGCLALKSLDLSSFNTINVNHMGGMFIDCYSLRSLNLTSFNTTNVKNMMNMFCNCYSLRSLDLSSFNTINVEDMYSMFYGCKSLISLNLSSFNTTNVKNMKSMFFNCFSLRSLDLSSFNTSNVENMDCMFYHCRSLLSLDLSSFNTINVKYMRAMFEGCFLLKKENVKLNKNETKIIQKNNQGNSEKIIINVEIDKYIDKKLSAREIVRFEPKFTQSVEEMDKETAYYQFLSINSYYERLSNKLFPKGFFNWKDPYLVSKLEAQIKQYNDDAEIMNEFVLSKAMDDFHPETMGMYVEILKHDDYIWQLLNRQLLIYNKFYGLIDEKTIEYIDYLKREEDNSKI